MSKSRLHKLIVTIPAYNEEKTISKVVRSVPRKIAGIGKVKVLVWSDGSTDKTEKAAKQAGADYVFTSKRNLGLARTFDLATRKAIGLGATIVVNTDADNQYDQREIPKLIRPILSGRADLVSGDRQITTLTHMAMSKRYGNMLGTYVVSKLAGISIRDASSGFRAYTDEVLKEMRLISQHTYTHETLIQAVKHGFLIAEVPVKFRERKNGESRLISGVWQHVKLSTATIIRTTLMYQAFPLLVKTGTILILFGLAGIGRFGYYYLNGTGNGHVQSLILSSILIGVGLNTAVLGIVADLVSINRKLLERSME